MSRKLREIRSRYGITERSAAVIGRMDPTENKKYVEWLAKVRFVRPNTNTKYRVADDFPANMAEDVKNSLAWFERNLNGKVPKEFRDINTFKTITEFLYKVGELNTPSRTEIKNAIRLVLENERWKILVPLTFAASRLYGTGTRWCTTQKNYFNNYTRGDNTLYYVIDKTLNRKFGVPVSSSSSRNLNVNGLTFFNNEDAGMRLADVKKVYGQNFDVVTNVIRTDYSNYMAAKVKRRALKDAIKRINDTKTDFNRNELGDENINKLFESLINMVNEKSVALNK
jgi:hypothetical protein